MPWRPLGSIVRAVCVHHFGPTEADDLALHIGDEVYITEVNGGPNAQWCRGWLLSQPSLLTAFATSEDQPLRPRAYAGIFPRNCVQVRETLVNSDRLSTGKPHAADRKILGQNDSAFRQTNGVATQPITNGASVATDVGDQHQRRGRAVLVGDLEPEVHSEHDRILPKQQAPLPALKIGDVSKASIDEPLIEDISACIREWHSTKLHSLTLQHDYKTLEALSALIDRLTDARIQLAQNILTEVEIVTLREQVVWDLVQGNKIVDNQVIVRSAAEKGRTLNAQDSLPDMLTLQATMSLRDEPIIPAAKEPHLHHLLVDIRELPQHLGEPAMLHMYLCSASGSGRPRPVSEAFAVELSVDESMNTLRLSEEFSRTFFTNLSNADVGGEDESDTRLYLICRLFRDEPFRRAAPQNSASLSDPNPDVQDQEGMLDGGKRRRSIMLNMRSRRGSEGNETTRPSNIRTMLQRNPTSTMHMRTTTPTSGSRPPTAEKKLRRAAGYSAVPVSSLLLHNNTADLSLAFWTPATPLDDSSNEQTIGDGWDDILRLLCWSPTGRFAKADSIGRFNIRLQALAHDNVGSLVRERPSLLRDVQCTPALALNGDSRLPRSDIYLTLKQPVLPANARAYDPRSESLPIKTETDLRNLQLTLEIRTEDGRRIEDSIYPTSNRAPHTAFRTPAVDRGEAWNQTIRLSIPSDEVSKAHIIMSIADGPYFPFALAWVPLWNEQSGFPVDGQQSLALWDYNESTANIVDGKGAYLSLPATTADLKQVANQSMASIAIETYLSSTTATQNGDVLAMLNVGRVEEEDLLPLLDRFQHVPDEEIVKFFSQLLSSLDTVLDEASEAQELSEATRGEQIADGALKCLSHVFRVTRDRRYPHLSQLLDEYVAQRSCTYSTRLFLIRALRSLLSNPFDARTGRDLRRALKVTDCILRFTFSHLTMDDGQEDSFRILHREFREFFEDIMVLLTNNNSLALPSQVIVVQNLASWLPEVAPVMSSAQALGLAIAIVDACSFSKSQLRIQRLVMIHNISCLDMFKNADIQAKIVSKTASWLRPHWPELAGVDDKALSALRLCCTIIKDQQPYMNVVQAQFYVMQLCNTFQMVKDIVTEGKTTERRRTGNKRKMFSPLFQNSFPFQNVPVSATKVPGELLLELTAVIGSFFQDGLLLKKVHESHDNNGVTEIGEADAGCVLSVLRSIRNSEAFPDSWLSFSVSFAKCQTQMLEWLLNNLLNALPDSSQIEDAEDVMEFDETVWEQWFDAAFALVTSPAVTMENHSDQKRRAVWMIGGDIRQSAAVLLQRAWLALGWENNRNAQSLYGLDRMGGFQVQFTTRLVPSVISIGLALHSGLREAALEILRSMIIGEWELSTNLEIVQSALADSFDSAFRDHRFEPSQAEILLQSLRSKFVLLRDGEASALYEAVMKMLRETEDLVDMLSSIHAIKAEDAASSLEQRLRLLEYLKVARNEDSYVRHVHDVSTAQANAGNFAAAAMALQLHVDLLDSDKSGDSSLSKAYPELGLPAQSVAQRKESLFSRMNSLFKQGHCWHKVLSALEDRNRAYTAMFDSASLVKAHDEQAEVYRLLDSGKGFKSPRYFRVAFSGNDLPAAVSGKTFVFEAAPDEDTSKFANRMRQQYPTAVVLHPGVGASKNSQSSPTVRISTVNVNRDQLHPINQQSGISPFFRVFHLTSSPLAFATSTRQEKPGIGVMEQTVEKAIYYTNERFPTLMGRSEIVREESVVLTPIQAAIDRTHRKTLDVAEATRSGSTTDNKDDDKLVRAIRASVDPMVTDSVASYHKLLMEDGVSERTSFTGTTTESESQINGDSSKTTNLRKVLIIALEEHSRAIEHALQTCFDNRLAIKQELREKFEMTFEPELYAIYPSGQWRVQSPAWIDPEIVQKVEEVPPPTGRENRDGESDTETEAGTKRPRSRRASLRKRLSFLSLSKA